MDLMREPYNFAAAHYAMDMIPERRRYMTLGIDELAGERYMNDRRVFEKLQDNYSDSQFGSDPEKYIDLALHDCARADYHYEHVYNYEGESDSWEGEDDN